MGNRYRLYYDLLKNVVFFKESFSKISINDDSSAEKSKTDFRVLIHKNTETVLTAKNLLSLPAKFGCPLWVYDADIIRQQIAKLRQFDVIRFAQKACSNISILKIMHQQGVKVDAVSAGEIERALAAGYRPLKNKDDIVFTADVIDESALALVVKFKILVNAGSIDMLEQLGKVSTGHRVWLRINPGFGHGHSQKTNTGGENSKHGIWHTDLQQALIVIQRYNLNLVGLHMHIGSGVDYTHLERVCEAMVVGFLFRIEWKKK
uniref:Orn/DAP/Arg decarboxylase 2 N-terminal domain-containing protein n=1 Tax=Panagrolaimus superbus TaxID=310955 RepID=A0A914Z659_9BILA